MSKHKRVWNHSIYNKYLREGRGQGIGSGYNPWIHIQDFPSLGMVSRVSGTTTGRIHHLMSNLEFSLFYLLEWADNVTDIREQYPLIDLAQAVERAFGLIAGMGLNIYKHLAYWRRIVFNVDEKVDLAEFRFTPHLCCAGGVM